MAMDSMVRADTHWFRNRICFRKKQKVTKWSYVETLKNCLTQQEGSRRGAFLCTCNKYPTFYTIDGEGMNMVAWWWLIVAAAIGAAFGIGMIAIASVDRGDEE